MPKGKNAGVDELLGKANPKQRALAQSLRQLIRTSIPESEEVVKWGNPTYLVGGRPVAWLLFYRDHIDLGFFQGVKLRSKRLEGTGKRLRHVKVRTVDEIDEVEFSRLLREASTLASVNK